MSDSTIDAAADEPVNLTKPREAAGPTTGRPATGAKRAPSTGPAPALPQTMKLAFLAMAIQIVAGLVRAVSLRGSSAQLQRYLIDTNTKAKHPKKPYTLPQIQHDLHSLRSTALITAIVIGLALIVLIVAMRRVRSAFMARWAVLIVAVITTSPFYVVPIKLWPTLPKAASVIFGLASIATIVLLLVPQSGQYFRDCRLVLNPDGVPAKPGMRSLFAPRAAAGAAGGSAARPARPARAGAAAAARPNPSSAKQRAKVRADEAAVAKGAELARTRAKSSKSRRTEV